MRRVFHVVGFCLVVECLVPFQLAAVESLPGIEERLEVWRDVARNREVPVKLYIPKETKGPLPIVIFSHGLGGNRETYAYLGRYWAGHGMMAVHVQHAGSDSKLLVGNLLNARQVLRESVTHVENWVNRPKDISFAIDRLLELNNNDVHLKGRMDSNRIGVAGHSYGGYTTHAVAGMKIIVPGSGLTSFADPRVKAAIAISPPGKLATKVGPEGCAFAIPCLHLMGSDDTSELFGTEASERRIPFDTTKAHEQFLVIVDGADHMVFSGSNRTPGRDKAKDARQQEVVCKLTQWFWDAFLKGDVAARAGWNATTVKELSGGMCSFEQK